jgi:predicted acylesterase/phospholipase RssA
MKLIISTFLNILLLATFVSAGTKKCRALVLSGGGDRGSYEAAVFIEFVNLLPLEEVSYDVITGVSAGSMNACGLGVFAPEEAVEASEFVFGLWNSIRSSDVFKMWPGGIVEGIMEKSGILDTQPLIEFTNTQVAGKRVKRKITFALADAGNGGYYTRDFNTSEDLPSDYTKYAIGSSSIPFAFPSLKHEDRVLVDGGSIWNVDIPSAVRRCKEIVDDENDIIIDMFVCMGFNV